MMYPTCSKCKKRNPTPSKHRCPTCLTSVYEFNNRRRARLRKLGLCYDCKNPAAGPQNTRCRSCLDRQGAATKGVQQRLKRRVLEAYGGAQCACCGETESIMLTIDHVAQNGAAHRRETGNSGQSFHRMLEKNGYPPGYRVLCRNCNYAVFFSPNHVCPHRTGVFSAARRKA